MCLFAMSHGLLVSRLALLELLLSGLTFLLLFLLNTLLFLLCLGLLLLVLAHAQFHCHPVPQRGFVSSALLVPEFHSALEAADRWVGVEEVHHTPMLMLTVFPPFLIALVISAYRLCTP